MQRFWFTVRRTEDEEMTWLALRRADGTYTAPLVYGHPLACDLAVQRAFGPANIQPWYDQGSEEQGYFVRGEESDITALGFACADVADAETRPDVRMLPPE